MVFWSTLASNDTCVFFFANLWDFKVIVIIVIAPAGTFMVTTSSGGGDSCLILDLKGMFPP